MQGLTMLTDMNMKHILAKVLLIIPQNTFFVQMFFFCLILIFIQEKSEFEINVR